MGSLRRSHWVCWAVWVVYAGYLAAQETPLPSARAPAREDATWPEDSPTVPPPAQRPGESTMPVAFVPNSGYAGGDSQWDRMNYIGETPMHDEPVGCVGGGCRDSDFTPFASTWQGVALLARSRTHDAALSTELLLGPDGLPVPGPDALPLRRSVFSSGDLPVETAPGYDEGVEGYLGRDSNNYDWFIQGGFRGFNDWVASGSVRAQRQEIELVNGELVVHGGLNSFFNGAFVGLDWADRHTARYNSRFNSAELNFVLRPHDRADRIVLYPNGQWSRERQPGTYWSFLMGFRYVDLDEGFALRGTGSIQDITGVNLGTVRGTYLAATNNEMFGLNFGTELAFRERRWELGFHFKASPMINTTIAASRVDATGIPSLGIPDRHAFDRSVDANVTALLELGAVSTYRLNENFAVRCGYDIAWLTGLALAPVQRPGANEVIDTGTVFIQGLILGLEYRR